MNILTVYPKPKAPYNVTIYKGSNQAALTRSFVLYFVYRLAVRLVFIMPRPPVCRGGGYYKMTDGICLSVCLSRAST